jgi:hypothetical protein
MRLAKVGLPRLAAMSKSADRAEDAAFAVDERAAAVGAAMSGDYPFQRGCLQSMCSTVSAQSNRTCVLCQEGKRKE